MPKHSLLPEFVAAYPSDDMKKACEILEKTASEIERLDPGDSESPRKRNSLLADLPRQFWIVAIEILRGKFRDGTAPDRLRFSDEEKIFLNTGYFTESLAGVPAQQPPKETGCPILPSMCFTDWLEDTFSMYFCRDIKSLASLSEAEMELRKKALLSRIKIMIPLLLSSGAASSMSRTEAENLVEEWGFFLSSYSAVSAKTAEWRTNNEEEKHRIAYEARKFLDHTENLRLLLAKREAEGDRDSVAKLGALLYECRNVALFAAYLSKEEDKHRKKQERMLNAYGDDPTGAKIAFLDLLGKKKEYAELMSKQVRMNYSPFLTAEQYRDMGSAGKIKDAVDDILLSDPGMLQAARIRMYGLPRIIVMPGWGVGSYDWSDNTFLLPIAPQGGNTLRAAAFAFASFRWDTDEDRILKDTYGKLKENKKKNIIELSVTFSKEYFLWVTKEVKGYRVLPRESHKWFSQYFVPKLDVF